MRTSIKFIFLFSLTVLMFVTDLLVGSVNIPLSELFSDNIVYQNILFNFRLPKAITAVVTGAAISVAGLVMQTLFRNPLAGPYVLGISSGASLGVAIFIFLGTLLPVGFANSGWGLIISSVSGAVLVLALVLGVSAKVRNAVTLLLVGIMFGQIAGSLVTILQNASNPDALKVFVVWTFGSLSSVTWKYMWAIVLVVAVGLAIVYSIQKPLNALLLSENYAQSLGVNLRRTRTWIIASVALLAGGTTAFTGPIAFIGMAVPHLVRGVMRSANHLVTISGCILMGASLLLICDIASQVFGPHPLPINAISALIGAPIIIWVLLRDK